MNLGNIAWTVFTVQIVLYDLASSLIVAGNAFSKFCDKRIECQSLRTTINSIYQVDRGNNVDLAVQHTQGVYRESALRAANVETQHSFIDVITSWELVRRIPCDLIVPGAMLQQAYDMSNIGDERGDHRGFVRGMFGHTIVVEIAHSGKPKAKEKEQHSPITS